MLLLWCRFKPEDIDEEMSFDNDEDDNERKLRHDAGSGSTSAPHFPALDRPAVFLDNPGGTQIARQALTASTVTWWRPTPTTAAAFATSRASDAVIDEARAAMADFLNAARPEEIVFGPNMTSLTFTLSRALASRFQPGDTIVVTNLDHDANISPWLRLAEDRDCRVRWVDFDPATGTLDQADFQAALAEKPKLVAFGYASNALGTVNPAAEMTAQAKAAGALVYIDAVQYAAHGPIDVQAAGLRFPRLFSLQVLRPARRHSLRPLRSSRQTARLPRPPRSRRPARQVRNRHWQLRGHRRRPRRAGILRVARPDLWRRTA